ncbi:hypothetical protein AMTR_s00157p00052260 [Amborella trichopoda]|uniref:Uncharacterized protein n=1 Tax=Amborella trichopoda TaxID=13333 RepID=W1PKE5_AMBTC|nr:hypothetical protein AMTR_s00157p00052260 [Amborella trichopoda]
MENCNSLCPDSDNSSPRSGEIGYKDQGPRRTSHATNTNISAKPNAWFSGFTYGDNGGLADGLHKPGSSGNNGCQSYDPYSSSSICRMHSNGEERKQEMLEYDDLMASFGAEAEQDMLRREIQEYTVHCAEEGKRLRNDIEDKSHQLNVKKLEAEEFLKKSKLQLGDVRKRYEEEIQICGGELLQLVDSISKHKEKMELTFSEMMGAVNKTANEIVDSHKASWLTRWGN